MPLVYSEAHRENRQKKGKREKTKKPEKNSCRPKPCRFSNPSRACGGPKARQGKAWSGLGHGSRDRSALVNGIRAVLLSDAALGGFRSRAGPKGRGSSCERRGRGEVTRAVILSFIPSMTHSSA